MKTMTPFIGVFILCLHVNLAWGQQADSTGFAHSMLLTTPEPRGGVVQRVVIFRRFLKDRMGKMPTADVGLTRSLYEPPKGGIPLWSESQTLEPDEQGRYTMLLRPSLPEDVPLDLFTTDHPLRFAVQPQLWGEGEQPRMGPKALKPATISGAIPATLFGMHSGSLYDWPTVSIGALGKGPSTLWPYVERSKGVFDWSNLDAWVNAAQSHGLSYFFSPEKVPLWAAADPSTCTPNYPGSRVLLCTSMVANVQDWDDYVTALVTRYKGKIRIYELWNEPNYFSGTIADMVTLTTHMHNIIRSIDPAAFILSPCPSTQGVVDSYMDRYFAAGGPTDVDGISFHTYTATPENVVNYVQDVKAVAARYGLASKPLWDTEGSWGTASLSSNAQVAAVARFYLLLWSIGVSRFYWLSWDDPAWGTLWDATNGPSPAALAYQQVYNWMVGAAMTTPCSADANSTWTCGFTRPGSYQAEAIWNTANTLSYTPPSKFTSYLDLAGNKHPIAGGAIWIGPQPILLVNSSR